MGEFSLTFIMHTQGKSRHKKIYVRPCANLNCTQAEGEPEILLVEEGDPRKFCGKTCRWDWNNKRGRVKKGELN